VLIAWVRRQWRDEPAGKLSCSAPAGNAANAARSVNNKTRLTMMETPPVGFYMAGHWRFVQLG